MFKVKKSNTTSPKQELNNEAILKIIYLYFWGYGTVWRLLSLVTMLLNMKLVWLSS